MNIKIVLAHLLHGNAMCNGQVIHDGAPAA
jgi:hypothetical protein